MEAVYEAAQADSAFRDELAWYRRHYVGGPTPLHHAKRLTNEIGGAQVQACRRTIRVRSCHRSEKVVCTRILMLESLSADPIATRRAWCRRLRRMGIPARLNVENTSCSSVSIIVYVLTHSRLHAIEDQRRPPPQVRSPIDRRTIQVVCLSQARSQNTNEHDGCSAINIDRDW